MIKQTKIVTEPSIEQIEYVARSMVASLGHNPDLLVWRGELARWDGGYIAPTEKPRPLWEMYGHEARAAIIASLVAMNQDADE